MSNENEKKTRRRPYTLKARARRWDEVHANITRAAVSLHQSVGPARTTMEAVARRAGVRRATVYNHFPTEHSLIDACSSHWFSENPPPDPSAWAAVVDPLKRARLALESMYRYYAQGQGMLEKVLRDAPVVPAMDEIRREKWQPLLDSVIDLLMHAFDPAQRTAALQVSLALAFDFFTWQRLAAAELAPKAAASLAVRWIDASMKTTPTG